MQLNDNTNMNSRQQQQANKHALKVYEARVGQYKQQVGFNNQALADAYETEQIRLNEIADQVEAANFDSMVQLMSVQGFAAASGKQGRRANMRDKSNAMQYGRNVARRLAGVDRATNAYLRNAEQLRVRTNNANQQAYAQVATAPMLGMAPLAPMARQMTSYAPPSAGAALANSLLDGVTAGVNFGAAIQ